MDGPLKETAFCLLGLVCMFLSQKGTGQIPEDKLLHFSAGQVSGAAGAFIASEISHNNRFWTFTGAVAASLFAGLAKEALDNRRYNGWDNADLGATVLGGITIGFTIDLFTARDRNRSQPAALLFRPGKTLYAPIEINDLIVFYEQE